MLGNETIMESVSRTFFEVIGYVAIGDQSRDLET